MKTKLLLLTSISGALFFSSCAQTASVSQGTTNAALGGAALGGIIGHQSGKALEGAALGGVLGGTAAHVNEQNKRSAGLR